MLAGDFLGLPIPGAGPVFAAALAVHIGCGLTAVTSGALAATARKRTGRHPQAGRAYLWALGGLVATATVMAAIRWHEDAHLFAIAVIALGCGLYGYRARRRHRPGWPTHHAIGLGGSYIALLTGFYVDNGPFLPLWDRLPHITYWLLPTIIGIPVIRRALRHFNASATVDRATKPWAAGLLVCGDGFVMGGPGSTVGFRVHERRGEARDRVDEPVFGVVGDGMRDDDGSGVSDSDLAFGAQLVADPAEPDSTDAQHLRGGGQDLLDLVDQHGVDGVH